VSTSVLALGEIIWDVYEGPEPHAVIGGAPLNFAAHCVRCGADCALISAVGKDPLGREAAGILRAFGVDDRYVAEVAAPTGTCRVSLDASGVPSYCITPDVAYDAIALTDEQLKEIRQAGYAAFSYGTLIQRTPAQRALLDRILAAVPFPEIFCDVNLRPLCYDRDSALRCLAHATTLKVSLEEEPLLRALELYPAPKDETPAAIAAAIASAYPRLHTVLLTDGPGGAYAYFPASSTLIHEPAVPVSVVSTVGAGDSFSAAYLVAALQGDTPEAALRKAVARSAFVVAHQEAIPKE
jgi:fructokinase